MNIKYENYDIETLIDNMPENIILYKDSGLWSFYDDSFDNVLLDQNTIETFKQFVIRFMYYLESENKLGWWYNLDIILHESSK